MAWFFSRKPKPPRVTMSAGELFAEIHTRLAVDLRDTSAIRLSDRRYVLPTQAEASTFIRNAYRNYRPETGDCDDLAFIAKAEACEAGFRLPGPLAFGVVWTDAPQGAGHAINWCLTDQRTLLFLDVQQFGEVPLPGTVNLLIA